MLAYILALLSAALGVVTSQSCGGVNVRFVPTQKYTIVTRNAQKVVDVSNGVAAGAVVHQWEYLDGANQYWYIKPARDDFWQTGYYLIIGHESNKAMRANGQSQAITIENTNAADDKQLWKFEYKYSFKGHGYYTIRNLYYSNMYLDVHNGATDNAQRVQVYPTGGTPQGSHFRIAADSLFEKGHHYRMQFQHSGSCLDASGTSTGNTVWQYTCHDGSNQRWELRPSYQGFFWLVNKASGLCMNLQHQYDDNVSHLSSCNYNDDKQMWKFIWLNDFGAFVLRSKAYGSNMDVYDANDDNEENIIVFNGNPSQGDDWANERVDVQLWD